MITSTKNIFRIKIDQGIILVNHVTDKRLRRYLKNYEQSKNQLRARMNRYQQIDQNKTSQKKFQTQRKRINILKKSQKRHQLFYYKGRRSISSKDYRYLLGVIRRCQGLRLGKDNLITLVYRLVGSGLFIRRKTKKRKNERDRAQENTTR